MALFQLWKLHIFKLLARHSYENQNILKPLLAMYIIVMPTESGVCVFRGRISPYRRSVLFMPKINVRKIVSDPTGFVPMLEMYVESSDGEYGTSNLCDLYLPNTH